MSHSSGFGPWPATESLSAAIAEWRADDAVAALDSVARYSERYERGDEVYGSDHLCEPDHAPRRHRPPKPPEPPEPPARLALAQEDVGGSVLRAVTEAKANAERRRADRAALVAGWAEYVDEWQRRADRWRRLMTPEAFLVWLADHPPPPEDSPYVAGHDDAFDINGFPRPFPATTGER